MMQAVNFENNTQRREDWKHTANAPVQYRGAKRIPPATFDEKPAKFDFKAAVKPEVHPLKMPATMLPAQADWTGGREYHDRQRGKVRLVAVAEVDEILDWAMPHVLLRYPRANKQAIGSYLRVACRGGTRRFFRTDNACGLFEFEQTAWEPMPAVREVFVAVREPQFAALDAKRIYSAGRTWAEEIGAFEFRYGESTGVDISPIAKKIGYDHRSYGFTKLLK